MPRSPLKVPPALGFTAAGMLATTVAVLLCRTAIDAVGDAVTIDRAVTALLAGVGSLAATRLALGALLAALAIAARRARSVSRRAARAAEYLMPRLARGAVRRIVGAALAGSAGLVPPAFAVEAPLTSLVQVTSSDQPAHGDTVYEDLSWRPSRASTTTSAPATSSLAPPRAGPTTRPPTSAVPRQAPTVAPPSPTATPSRPGPDSQPGPAAAGRTAAPPPAAGSQATVKDKPDVEGTYVVKAGDCLWTIAADRLGPHPDPAEVGASWPRWYEANRQTIGADPHLIRPGQRLHPPQEES